MTLYIGLLRGINVGGNHKIKMAELKKLLEEMGLRRVQTYIQSGNLAFESDEREEALRTAMESAIEGKFGFPVPVVLRTAEELDAIARVNPYSPDELEEGWSIHVLFYPNAVAPEQIEALPDLDIGSDEFFVDGREIYQLYRRSMTDSKLPQKLGKLKGGTDRNWKTVVKLMEMAAPK
ncbi:DUF1697 domain-containing protein [Cohnella zeiphila]|uniref:DUF1697 domain-containing protein n=1 Tax=Cohnella zeiphila TaxID=2761120 RepID=A0A7X0VTY4_9BACL|nr:DUF1697 domain-containing protein [Cohnella zeiphila]MBB6730446.1 DUF1697 domain-containing protein [Cohnella zeiphila]